MATSITDRRTTFRNRFGENTFNALVVLAKEAAGRKVPARITKLEIKRPSLSAYRANLTRGAYKGFVTVNRKGTMVDNMDLVNVR